MEEAFYLKIKKKKSFLAARFYVWKTFLLMCFEYKGLFDDGNNFFIAFEGILIEVFQIWKIYDNNHLKNRGSNPYKKKLLFFLNKPFFA